VFDDAATAHSTAASSAAVSSLGALSRPQTLSRDAADAVRRAIVSGELAEGDRVSEAGLAERLGVSRQPVRDALRVLVQEGLLAQRGNATVVLGYSADDIRQLYELRAHLETLAIRATRHPLRAGTAAALRRAMDRMDLAGERADAAAYVDADLAFHRALCQAGGNRWLLSAWDGLAPTLQATMLLGNKHVDRRRAGETHHRHARVLAHLLAGDTAAAEAALRDSLVGPVARLIARLRPHA
jgi:GntR family transcriptional regulator, gluconate operon transcriptional repressor